MLRQKKRRLLKTGGALLLSFMMAVVFMPTFAFAAEKADDITVFMTVSYEGTIASTKDGEAMAWKRVTVEDLDSSGDFTFDEALVAAHKEYSVNGEADYNLSRGATVNKLWGRSDTNNLFFVNCEGLPTGVGVDKVSENDFLIASANADNVYWSDWLARFDVNWKPVDANEEFTLNLKGHLGMAYMEEDKQFVNLEGIQIGTWTEDGFAPLEGAVTDENGEVKISFDSPGTYIVTAKGTVEGTVTDWNLQTGSEFSMPPDNAYVKYDEELDSYFGVGYTEEDHGNGPYPIEEVKWIDWMEWYSDTDSYPNLLYSNTFSGVDCPIMAPCCIVEVVDPADPADVTVTINNKGVLASAKDGSAMAEKPVTVTDINEDGKLTYDEALSAAHDAYFDGGAEAGFKTEQFEGYTGLSVTKLWGVDTSNTLFDINGTGIYSVSIDEVEQGDNLYASLNADSQYYSDFRTTFDKTTANIKTGQSLDVTLNFSSTMGGEPNSKAGVEIGIWKDGAFEAIEGAVTDENGAATVSFDTAGEYILTANGTVSGEVSDYSNWPEVSTITKVDCPIMAPYCIVTVTESSGGSGGSGGSTTPTDSTEAAAKSLDTAIDEAETLNSAEYTADSYQALQEVVAAAKAVAEKTDATAAELAAAKKAIEDAKAALVKAETITEGAAFVVDGSTVTVTAVGGDGVQGAVTYTKAEDAASVTVPETVTLADGQTYPVTAIGTGAFADSSAKVATIGANVKTLEAGAFTGSKVTKLIIKTKKLTKASVKASLKGSAVKIVKVKVGKKKVNKKFVKKYKKIFTKKNAGKKVKVK